MITTYWRIPNIFTISQEHKGKTTGNGANFPTLHSNKPEQRSEKINVGTRRGCSLEPQKVTREAPVKARHVYPRAGRGQRGGGSGVQGFHSCTLQQKPPPGSPVRKEDGDLGSILPSVGSPRWPAFSQPHRQRTSLSGWLTLPGAAQPAAGRDGQQDGVCWLIARAQHPVSSGLLGAELGRHSEGSPSPAPAPPVMPRPWTGSEVRFHFNLELSHLENL